MVTFLCRFMFIFCSLNFFFFSDFFVYRNLSTFWNWFFGFLIMVYTATTSRLSVYAYIYIYIISEWLHQMLTIFNDTSHWWQIIYAWCAYTYIVFQYKFNELICDVPFWFLWPIQFYRWIQPMQWCDTWTIELHNNLLRLIKIVHVNSVVLICIFFFFSSLYIIFCS